MTRPISHLLLLLWLLIPVTLTAQGAKPVIDGPVRNGASFDGFIPNQPFPFPLPLGSGLAKGSIFVVFGSGLGPEHLVSGAVPYGEQLPAAPGGTRVTFRSRENDQVYSAYLIHAANHQVAGIVPSQIPAGRAEAWVSYNGAESEPRFVQIVESSPALFTVDQSGMGPAVIQNYESASVQTLNSLTNPARPGQYLILWATGLGPIEGPDNVRPPVGNLRNDVGIRLNGVSIPAEYAGRSAQFPGVDQINVRIPDAGSIELGCYQDVELKVGNSSLGRNTTVALSDRPGACVHPWGLSVRELANLDNGGTAAFLHLYLGGSDVSGRIARADASGVARNSDSSRSNGSPFSGLCFPGFFTVLSTGPSTAPLRVMPFPPGLLSADAGSLRLVGPDLRGIQLVGNPYFPGSLQPKSELAEDYFIPGEWTLRGGGGNDIASFETAFQVPPLPAIDLPESVKMSGEMELSWDPESYQAGEMLQISLSEANPGQTSGTSYDCYVPASSGSVRMYAPEDAEAGSKLRWGLSLDGPPHVFRAPGLEHGQIVIQPRRTQDAIAVE